MLRTGLVAVLMAVGSMLLAACVVQPIEPTSQETMLNPASVYCEQNGGKIEFRQDASGGVAGVCLFPDGSECDEWAYFRRECKPSEQSRSAATSDTDATFVLPTDFPTPLPIVPADYEGWWTYTNSTYGFSLRLPPDLGRR